MQTSTPYVKLVILFISMVVISLGTFLFLGLDVDTQNILTSLSITLGAFISSIIILPIMGRINVIKKRSYFYRWNNMFFYTSIVFFIFSPLVLWYMLALQS